MVKVALIMKLAVDNEIHLSAFQEADKPALLRHFNETDVYHRFMRTVPYPYTEADADEWFARLKNEGANRRTWAIRDENALLIGGCGLKDLLPGHSAEIGYWLAQPCWSRGIMTKTVRKLCEFAFAEFQLVRIYAYVLESNVASSRVLTKSGFRLEGTLRKHDLKDGEFADSRLYGLVK